MEANPWQDIGTTNQGFSTNVPRKTNVLWQITRCSARNNDVWLFAPTVPWNLLHLDNVFREKKEWEPLPWTFFPKPSPLKFWKTCKASIPSVLLPAVQSSQLPSSCLGSDNTQPTAYCSRADQSEDLLTQERQHLKFKSLNNCCRVPTKETLTWITGIRILPRLVCISPALWCKLGLRLLSVK